MVRDGGGEPGIHSSKFSNALQKFPEPGTRASMVNSQWANHYTTLTSLFDLNFFGLSVLIILEWI